jgi:UDP-N-acetyl-D-mannosaminuronic acid transferase (WecB/TagA/CpsF family)
MHSTTLFGISLWNGKYRDFLDLLKHPEKNTIVMTPNPEIFVRASRDPEFHSILEKADYAVPDGNGLYVGYMMNEGKSFLLAGMRVLFSKKSVEKKYGELIKGSDLTRDLIEYSAKK